MSSKGRRAGSLLCSALALALSAAAAGCGSSSAPNPATERADVTAVYGALFHFADKSLSDKEAAVQDGATLKEGLSQAMSSPFTSGVADASVSGVTPLSAAACQSDKVPAPCASVAYAIVASNGTAVLPGQTGYATYVDGKWVVAKLTICGLLESLYGAEQKLGYPPGCAPS